MSDLPWAMLYAPSREMDIFDIRTYIAIHKGRESMEVHNCGCSFEQTRGGGYVLRERCAGCDVSQETPPRKRRKSATKAAQNDAKSPKQLDPRK
jgi:hypothetical protein